MSGNGKKKRSTADDLTTRPRLGGVSPRHPEKPGPTGTAGASGTGTFSDFIYRGGPVINTPEVHILFAGDWASTANQNRATRLSQFVTDLLSSRYMNILSQYGCGTSGTVSSSTFVTVPDNDLSATDIHGVIQAAIDANDVPEPINQATCVLLYLDDATGVEDADAGAVMCEASSDNAFGYHDHFVTTAGNTYPFAIVPGLSDTCLTESCPDDSSCSLHLAQTQEQRQTQVTSHELAEMFSDPRVGSNEAWTSDSGPHENGDICNGETGTITVGSNAWNVQEMYSKWHDMNTNGSTTCITESDPLPSLLPACTIILDRSTFGKGEVDALLHISDPALVDAAFYVVADGFTPDDLKITSASLSGTPNVRPNLSPSPGLAGVTFEPTALVAEDPTLGGGIQRFTWVYRTIFTSSNDFPQNAGEVTHVALSAGLSRAVAPVVSAAGAAVLDLTHEPNPYEVDGPVSWLSTDLRVFQIPAGNSKFNATMGPGAADAPTFIKEVIANLNSGSAGTETFDGDLPTDEDAAQLELSESVNGKRIFNFAVAKVRYRSLSEDVSNVRVFFRLFPVSTTSTSYDQGGAYARGGQGGTVIPLLGLNGGGISTIPAFAEPRIDTATQSMNAQEDPSNVQTIDHLASGQEKAAYFGAWLDINQPSQPRFPLTPPSPAGPYTGGGLQTIQQLIRGSHQCLVAEIAFDPDPIAPGATPGSSDKLAQRNLSIVASANPGKVASRTVPNTFELARTPLLDGAPNELLIDWTTLPANSSATIYLPGVSASAIKQMADERYVHHDLTVVDEATLECPAQGIAYVPVPWDEGPNLPGLITVTLPEGIRRGEAFKVVVRELTDAKAAFVVDVRHDGPGARSAAAERAKRRSVARWRRVTGSYQISIPIRTKDTMLRPEERLLAVLRWILGSIPTSDRWYRVFSRYVEQIAERVEALGGDPDSIEPSPYGEARRTKEHGGERRSTGKVREVIFDCFGDFSGFVLAGCEERRLFESREPGVGRLVMQAARERLTITVCGDGDPGEAIERIVVHGG